MNSSRKLVLLCIIHVILLFGCFGGSAQKTVNEVQHRAETKHLLGISTVQKGDVKEAEKLLQESLRLSSSIDDSHGKTRELINLSRLYRISLQDMSMAQVSINAALDMLTPESGFYTEAVQEKALIELVADIPTALKWAEKAVAAEKGAQLGRRLNLLGRIQMAGNDKAAAAFTLQKALTENRKNELQEEEANSLRMLAVMAREEKRLSDSEKLLNETLEIDKKIGISSKIAIDMEELATTAIASGVGKNAIPWLQRAFDVNRSGGRPDKAAANLNSLADLYQKNGQSDEAVKTRKKAEDILQDKSNQSKNLLPQSLVGQ